MEAMVAGLRSLNLTSLMGYVAYLVGRALLAICLRPTFTCIHRGMTNELFLLPPIGVKGGGVLALMYFLMLLSFACQCHCYRPIVFF